MKFLKFIFFLLLISTVLTPVHAEFGVRFTANKRITLDLDGAGKKISYRFTCLRDMALVAASIFCAEAASSPSYLLSLQEDKDGFPSGLPLASSG